MFHVRSGSPTATSGSRPQHDLRRSRSVADTSATSQPPSTVIPFATHVESPMGRPMFRRRGDVAQRGYLAVRDDSARPSHLLKEPHP